MGEGNCFQGTGVFVSIVGIVKKKRKKKKKNQFSNYTNKKILLFFFLFYLFSLSNFMSRTLLALFFALSLLMNLSSSQSSEGLGDKLVRECSYEKLSNREKGFLSSYVLISIQARENVGRRMASWFVDFNEFVRLRDHSGVRLKIDEYLWEMADYSRQQLPAHCSSGIKNYTLEVMKLFTSLPPNVCHSAEMSGYLYFHCIRQYNAGNLTAINIINEAKKQRDELINHPLITPWSGARFMDDPVTREMFSFLPKISSLLFDHTPWTKIDSDLKDRARRIFLKMSED